MAAKQISLKAELAAQAKAQPVKTDEEVKLTKNMTIPDMVKVMMPEIKKALPSVMSPERFTRIALSALIIHHSCRRVHQCHFWQLY